MTIADLGYRIRQARIASRLTQAELATSAGISRTTLNHLENGLITDLGIRKVEAILERLGLSIFVEASRRSGLPDYLKLAATTASASFAASLSRDDVHRFLVTGKIPRAKGVQIRKLLEEAPATLIQGLLRQVAATNKPGRVEANLRRVAHELKISPERILSWKMPG